MEKNQLTTQVSIIVPVHNETYQLQRCLESMAKQTVVNLEIVCVDDGSDNEKTKEILKNYEQKYPQRFRVYHIPNNGVWNARKYGISVARGNIIGFCDSDDTFHKDMIERMLFKMESERADIVICGFRRIDEETKKIYSVEMTNWKQSIFVKEDMGSFAVINTALWNKLYSKNILTKAIDFETPPRIAEDMMFLMSIYPYVNKIAFVDEPLYDYYVHAGSSMRTVQEKDCMDTIYAYRKLAEQIGNYSDEKEWKELVDVMAFLHLGISLPVTLTGDKKLRKKIRKKIDFELENRYHLWKKSHFLKYEYIKKHNSGLWKLKIMRFVYKFQLFSMFLNVYEFMTIKLKKDVKW